MKATRDNLRFFAGCAVTFAYDAWNTAAELAGAWLARQDEKAASALGGEDGNWIFEELEQAAAEYRAIPDEYKPLLLRRSMPPYCSSCGIPHDPPMHYDGGES